MVHPEPSPYTLTLSTRLSTLTLALALTPTTYQRWYKIRLPVDDPRFIYHDLYSRHFFMTYDELAVAVDALECKDILGQHTCEKVNEARYCYYPYRASRTLSPTKESVVESVADAEEAAPLLHMLPQATKSEAEAAAARAHEAVGLVLDRFRGGKGDAVS